MLEYVFYLLWCDYEADHGMTSFVRNTVSIILKKDGHWTVSNKFRKSPICGLINNKLF
jgi:hypothetical protein